MDIACGGEPLRPEGNPGDVRELCHQSPPPSAPQAREENSLRTIPAGDGPLKHVLAGLRQRDLPLSPVLARPAPDPSLLFQRLQGAGERRTVENEDLPEAALGELPGLKEDLEKSELCDGQARASYLLVVELTYRPRSPAQVRARAGQDARTVGALPGKPSPDRGLHTSTLTLVIETRGWASNIGEGGMGRRLSAIRSAIPRFVTDSGSG